MVIKVQFCGGIMKNEYICKTIEGIKCVYITKENVEDFVNEYGTKRNGIPDKHTIKYGYGYAIVKYETYTWNIRLNAFMVQELEGWVGYTEKEFNKYYEIIV